MKNIILSLVLFLCALSVSAQDTNYMRQVLRQLTSEQFKGRGYSFRGDSIAAEYIRKELRRLQVKPLADNYFQSYSFSTFAMEGPLRLKVNDRKLKPYEHFRVPAWSKSTWGEYKVITVSPEVMVDTDAMRKFLKKNNDMLQDVFVYIDAGKWQLSSLGDAKKVMAAVDNLRRRNPFNSRGIIVGLNSLNTCSPAYTDYEHGYAYIEVLDSLMPQKVIAQLAELRAQMATFSPLPILASLRNKRNFSM